LQSQLDGAKDRLREVAEAAAEAAESRVRAEIESKVVSAEEDAKSMRVRLQATQKEMDEVQSVARTKSAAEGAVKEAELKAAKSEAERLAGLLQGYFNSGANGARM